MRARGGRQKLWKEMKSKDLLLTAGDTSDEVKERKNLLSVSSTFPDLRSLFRSSSFTSS